MHSRRPYLLSGVASVLTVAELALICFLCVGRSDVVEWAGWVCLWTSGIFGVLPIIALRRRGGVAKGQSYVRTTALVDRGIYAIVRQPQNGTAWMLINLGIALVAQHWSSWVLGLLSTPLVYADTFKADQRCIEEFGDPYMRYRQRVPRVNFVAGLIPLARRWASAEQKVAAACS